MDPRSRHPRARRARRREVPPPAVHRHPGRDQERRGPRPPVRRGPRRRRAVRRLVDRGVRAHRRVGHVPRSPTSQTFQVLPWPDASGARVGGITCDIANPDGTPFEGCPRSVLKRAIARAAAMDFRMVAGPGGRVLPVPAQGRRALHRHPRHRRLLRPGAGRSGRGRAARDRAGARADGLPGRGRASRGGAGPARGRLPLRRRAAHGRQRQHLPLRGEERRPPQRAARHLHAQADLRGERVGHAHAPDALQGRRPTPSSTPSANGS